MKCLPCLLGVALILMACGAQPAPRVASRTLTVFAAASLSDAFKELGRAFEASNNDVQVSFNFAGSDQLAQQIIQGAPADVFASANAKQMEVVLETAEAENSSVKVFASNRLAVVYPRTHPAQLQSLRDLSKPGLKIVLADKAVPAGAYALEVLTKASSLPEYSATYSETVLKNVVSYEQSVRAVLSKVALGEADAGIVYATDAFSVKDGSVGVLDIPDELNVLASYPIVVLKRAQQRELAQKFIDFVLSEQGQGILKAYGFGG